MRKNIIAAALIASLAAAACWWLSRFNVPAPATPAAPLSDLVAFGSDTRSIGKLTKGVAVSAMLYDANSDEPVLQEIFVPPGTWLVPEPAIRIADRKETDE